MRPIDADALIEFCAERWIPLNIDAVNMQPTIQLEKAQLSQEGTTKGATSDMISRQALCEYALNQKDKSVSPNDIMRFPAVQPEPHWIPVSERLPKVGQTIIAQCRANIIKTLKLDSDGDWYQDAEHCYMSGFVIAWMPLPEPYKPNK